MIEKVGLVAYTLALPPDLEKIHNVFHVSMLRRYRSNPSCNTLKYTLVVFDKFKVFYRYNLKFS